jgi:hypothetical protein
MALFSPIHTYHYHPYYFDINSVVVHQRHGSARFYHLPDRRLLHCPDHSIITWWHDHLSEWLIVHLPSTSTMALLETAWKHWTIFYLQLPSIKRLISFIKRPLNKPQFRRQKSEISYFRCLNCAKWHVFSRFYSLVDGQTGPELSYIEHLHIKLSSIEWYKLYILNFKT